MVNAADIIIFDRERLKESRNRRAPFIEKHDFLAKWAGEQLADRLNDIKRKFENVIQIGAAIPRLHDKAVVVDLSEALLKNEKGFRVAADEEFLPFKDSSLDLIVSNLTLHTTNDLPGTLLQIRRALKPDGLFLAAMLGGETLHELRASLMNAEIDLKGGASPRIFPFADKQQMGALMQRANFALPVVDSEKITVTYDNAFALMHDVRGMMEGNIIQRRSKHYPGRNFFFKAAEDYAANFSDPDGRIRASFEIIFLIGWAPHESQQKPLQPGSAKTRLADALGTAEIKTPQ